MHTRPFARLVTVVTLTAVAVPVAAQIWTFRGDPVSYRVDGAGSPVVQVHGIGAGASSEQTEPQIATLVDAGYRVYSLDLTGWGASIGPERLFTGPYYRDLLASFLIEVVDAPAAIVAQSLGATYAIGAAAQVPERVTAMVLNAPPGVDSFTDEADLESALSWQRFVNGAAGQGLYAVLGAWPSLRGFCVTTLYVDPSYCSAETVQDYWQYTQQPASVYAAASFLSGNLGLDVRKAFAGLSMPLTLIWGAQNALTPVTEGESFVALNPTATLHVIDDAGPLVNEERQAQFDRLMLETLSH